MLASEIFNGPSHRCEHFDSKNFDSLRNDPNFPLACSNLSPWINAGQVSFQRLVLAVRALKKHPGGTAAYIEEGVVRRELSDNFVYYTPDGYDRLTGAAVWAQDSLELHRSDAREHLYDWQELEAGRTHDDLWNAAQLQLVREGGMHGFVSGAALRATVFVARCRPLCRLSSSSHAARCALPVR